MIGMAAAFVTILNILKDYQGRGSSQADCINSVDKCNDNF